MYGLKVVAQGVNPVVDIIAVHGLNGDRDETWTAANGVHWLRDLLPNGIANARILCWGYDANTHSTSGVSCQYLYDHARSLVSDLCLERNVTNTRARPIIFVAHSLGGIIVKSALIHSDVARKGALEDHRSIRLSTHGIIFMGTPHQGGSGVQLGKLMVNIASMFVKADDRLLRHLERDSEWLQQQLGQYGPISGDFVTKFAYEGYATKTALGHSIVVVPRASAVVPGAADAEPIVIHADHINMVKFASKDDNGYRTVSGHLQIMARDAGGLINARWEAERRVNAAHANTESFSVPFSLSEARETEHFVAREAELVQIDDHLRKGDGRRTVTLQGLGGIGKTQLAIAYVLRHRADYSAIFWLNIKTKDSVMQSLARAARRIASVYPSSGLGAVDGDQNLDQVVSAAKRWLDRPKNTRWLLVYDNYDNPKMSENTDPAAVDIHQFLPDTYHGSVIITTRSSGIELGHQIPLQKLGNLDDSLKILSTTSRRDGVGKDPDAEKLAKQLDGLPLALATAGAYLGQVTTTLAEYLRLYNESWLSLHKSGPKVRSYEDRALYSTWQLSYNHIKRQNELSVKLLELWAYFDNQDLWFELLRKDFLGYPEWSPPAWLRQLTEDEISFNMAIRPLLDHGLVEVVQSSEYGAESKGYSVHSCVHSWTTHVLNQSWQDSMVAIALHCVGSHVPEEDTRNCWLEQRRLIRHAARSWEVVMKSEISVDGEESALHRLGDLYRSQGKLNEAEQMYKRTLCGKEKILGSEHISTLSTVHNLGILYGDQGKLDKAEQMYERALHGQEKILGPEHISTLHTVNNLGILYDNQGKLDKAEQMYERALHGQEKRLGPEHISTLHTVNNLGVLYENQGKLDKAEQLYERALHGKEKILGPEHISTLSTVNNLGVLYKNQGKLNEAEQMYKRTLCGKEKILGSEHISTLSTVNNFGILYENQGKRDKAEQMYERALHGQEKILGPEHISTLQTVINFGMLYENQGKPDMAEQMYKRALRGYEKALGPVQAKTYRPALKTSENMGVLYAGTGRSDEAREMYRRALEGWEVVLGRSSRECLDLTELISVLDGGGKIDDSTTVKRKRRESLELMRKKHAGPHASASGAPSDE